MATFTSWDYAVVAITLIISSILGVIFSFIGKKEKTTTDYLLADHSMSVFPVAFSVTASYISTITLMGAPSEIYQFGAIICYSSIALLLATPTIAYVILPVFSNLGATSIYEYLEQRFGFLLRTVVSLIFTFQQVLFMAIALYAPALALETVTELNKSLAISVIGLVCTFYSTIGGIKGVIATDILQGILMMVPLLGAIVYATIETKSFTEIWEIALEHHRLNFAEFDWDLTSRYTLWSCLLGNFVLYTSLIGANQVQVQRFSTVKDLKDGQKCVWWNLVFMTLIQVVVLCGSIAIYWYYHDCDPLLEGRITSRDQLLPLFIMDNMGHIPGLPGLMVAGLFCGTLSSVSSVINSLSAIVLEDYLRPLNKVCCRLDLSKNMTLLTTKTISMVLGIIFTASAFLGDYFGGLLESCLTLSGVTAGPILGVFLLGMLTMKANHSGALIGLVIGVTSAGFIAFVQPKAPLDILELSTNSCFIIDPQDMSSDGEDEYFWLYNVSYMWYSVIGILTTIISGYVWSWILFYCRLESNAKLYIDNHKFNAMLLSPVFVEVLVYFGWQKYEGSDEDLYATRRDEFYY